MLRLSNFDGVTVCHGVTGRSVIRMQIYFYLLDDLLIDTGSARLGRYSSGFFLSRKIRAATLTHVHEDHTGMAGWLTEKLGIPVFLHEGEHREAESPGRLPFYRYVVWGKRGPFNPAAMPAQLSTELYSLDVIPSPGHCPNHVVFHEKNKGWLFTGDLYVASKQHVSFYTENTMEAITSIRRLLCLDWETLFCAHSGVRHDGRSRLKLKLDYLESIQAQVGELYRKGLSVKEIEKCLFPKKNLWEIISRGEWSSYRIISTVVPGFEKNDDSG